MGIIYNIIYINDYRYCTKGKTNRKTRITLTSKEVRPLENVCNALIKNAKEKDIRIRGPTRMPTKNLVITTRKSPCGEGTNTWDKWEMKLHKSIMDLICSTENVKKITDVVIEPGVEVEISITENES